MAVIFWIAFGLILYVYAGYHLLLKLTLAASKRRRPARARHRKLDTYPTVSVIIAAHNEEAIIGKRIENVLASDYPKEKLEVIVASDGSSDGTLAVAKRFSDELVRALDLPRRGKALTHNRSVEEAHGELLIFTDAAGWFDPSFINEVATCFSDPSVGCVNGNLFFVSQGQGVAPSFNLYWEAEKKIFALENALGILATTSGTCTAVLRRLWKPLSATDDVDFCTALDVIFQGHRVAFASSALAYDLAQPSIKKEFKARIRIASKNFSGTLRRWGLRGWVAHPMVSFGLLSHKLLRYLSPFLLAVVFMSNLFLLDQGLFWKSVFSAQLLFYATGCVGGVGEAAGVRLPVASSLFSFIMANLAIAVGVLKGLAGRAPAYYK